jgi:hypothetical protein
MSSELLYSEIMDKFEKAQTKEERLQILRRNGDERFKQFLIMSFNPYVKFDVQIPNYRPAVEPAGLNYAYLDTEMPKMYRFIENHKLRPAGLTGKKQSSLLLVILESLHKEEAFLLVRMLRKDLAIKFLTPKLIKEAFPDIDIPTKD